MRFFRIDAVRHYRVILFCSLLVSASLLWVCSCATPARPLRPEYVPSVAEKIPLIAAIIFPSEREAKIWRPELALQGYLPRDVHTGKVLFEVTARSMMYVFKNVLVVEDVNAGLKLGAEALVEVECSFRPTLDPPELPVFIRLRTIGLDGSLIRSVEETGVYNHTWTAIDDGAFNNALVAAYEKIIPQMLDSFEIRQYARDLPSVIAGLRVPKTVPAQKPEPTSAPRPQASQPPAAPASRPSQTQPSSTPPAQRPSPRPAPASKPSTAEISLLGVCLSSEASTLHPAAITRQGQVLNMVMEYSVSSSSAGTPADLVEIRSISFGGNVLVEVADPVRRADGAHTSVRRITLPAGATPGSYVFTAVIRSGKKEIAKSFDFKIQ